MTLHIVLCQHFETAFASLMYHDLIYLWIFFECIRDVSDLWVWDRRWTTTCSGADEFERLVIKLHDLGWSGEFLFQRHALDTTHKRAVVRRFLHII